MIRPEEVEAEAKAAYARVAEAHKRVKENLAAELDDLTHEQVIEEPDDPMLRTAVSGRQLAALNEQLLTFPKHFTPNTKLHPPDGAAQDRDCSRAPSTGAPPKRSPSRP